MNIEKYYYVKQNKSFLFIKEDYQSVTNINLFNILIMINKDN